MPSLIPTGDGPVARCNLCGAVAVAACDVTAAFGVPGRAALGQ